MPHGFAPASLDAVSQVIKTRYVDSGAIPGALTLAWRRGEVVHLGLSGFIDLERKTAMRADAIFRIYSMTKPITSVALLMLMEEGKVALDDPVHRFIPGFERLGVFAGGNLTIGFLTTPAARPMKVIDLLRHTAGLTYGFHTRTNLDAAYTKLGIGEPATEGGLAAMIAQLELLPLEFSPGEAWNYSVATDVVGYLVEKLSGMAFADFVRLWECRTPISRFRMKSVTVSPAAIMRRPASCIFMTMARNPPMPRRPSCNRAAAGWQERQAIICASAACCWRAARWMACVCSVPKPWP